MNLHTNIDSRILALQLSVLLSADQPWRVDRLNMYPWLCRMKDFCQDAGSPRSDITGCAASIPNEEVDNILRIGDLDQGVVPNCESLVDIVAILTREYWENRR